MERMLALAITDKAFMPKLVSLAACDFELTHEIHRGCWGLGFHRHGEILVKKRPISPNSAFTHELTAEPARHLVAYVDDDCEPGRSLHWAQPFRYRNWLFSMVGAERLDADFADRVSSQLRGFTADGRWMESPAEAVMMIFMHALHRVGELNFRGSITRDIHRALRSGIEALTGLVGGSDRLCCALTLHVRGFLFSISLGEPVRLLRYGADRLIGQGSRHRQPYGDATQATALFAGDARVQGDSIPPWSMLELATNAVPRFVSLGTPS